MIETFLELRRNESVFHKSLVCFVNKLFSNIKMFGLARNQSFFQHQTLPILLVEEFSLQVMKRSQIDISINLVNISNTSLMNPSGYVNEIRSIDGELKNIAKRGKSLRNQKKVAQNRLYDYMRHNGLDEFEGIKKKSICPKPKKDAKTKQEKRDDAVELLRQKGVPYPEDFYDELMKTQRPTNV